MSTTSETDHDRRLLVEEAAQLDRVADALRIGGAAVAPTVLDDAANETPTPRGAARDWGTAGDAQTADVLLAGLPSGDIEHVLNLLDQQQRRERTNARPVVAPMQSGEP